MSGDALSSQFVPTPSEGVVNGATIVMIYDLERRIIEKMNVDANAMNKVLDNKLSYKHFTLILGVIMSLLSAQLYAIWDNQRDLQFGFRETRETLIKVEANQNALKETLQEFTFTPK